MTDVFLSWNINKDKDTVRMFDSRLLPFEQDDLILLGLLLGGDYDNNVFFLPLSNMYLSFTVSDDRQDYETVAPE